MASLAGLLQLEGHRITGSDKAAYPPMSDLLRGLGIPVLEPYAEANLDSKPDLVVIGNALSRGNPEVERVLDERIPFTSMAALLREEFLVGRESLVVAGTHGKTTTTSMLAWIYQVAARETPALEPSFLIGGVAENFGSSFQLRPTPTFIVEGDEYDTAFFDKGPKFLHYFPDALILTHVEFDHADIYADLDAVKTAFKRLVNLVPRRGLIMAFDGSENVTECVSHALCRVERYGFSQGADWRLNNLRHESGFTRWEVWRGGVLWDEFEMRMAGGHNALNATAAAALAFGQGVKKEAILAALKSFKSVKRRLEVRAEIAGITVIEDFAHHPTAIRETLRALRSVYPKSRLWAVFWSRARTRCAARSSKPISWQACAWPIAWCSPASISSNASPMPSAFTRRMWSANLMQTAQKPSCFPMRMQSSTESLHSSKQATWWRSSPMAASTAFMRNCQRGSVNFIPDRTERPLCSLLSSS
jgi:UDP-N-acetylmuramate: L-alanyl-gamma-D-glutamyl-meso-diaminopimelate ligase